MKHSFAASNGAARYYHGDLTGSTNALTDTSGAMLTGGTAAGTRSITMHLCWETPRATTTNTGAMLTGGTTTNGGPFYYTSFGERVYYDSSSSSWKLGGEFPIGSPRYMYDGGHGYETGHLALSGANSTLAPITFQHVGQRWYQPEIGRFVQRDPIGINGALNVYEIVNPLFMVDPVGTAPTPPIGFPGPTQLPIGDIWSVLNRPVTWPAIRATTVSAAAYWFGWVSCAATVGWQAGRYADNSFTKWNGGVSIAEGMADLWINPSSPDLPLACFVAGTDVWTPHGWTPIEHIAPGQEVCVWNEKAGACAFAIVTQCFAGAESTLVEIVIANESLIATPEHPFLLRNASWVCARDLQPGDMLMTADGDGEQIKQLHVIVQRQPSETRTFNFTVSAYDTFIVGRSGVIVHNSNTFHK